MKHPISLVLLTICILFLFSSCHVPLVPNTPDAPLTEDTEVPTTLIQETEAETDPPVRYAYICNSEVANIYQDLCIGPSVENSEPSIWTEFDLSLDLASHVIYATPNQTFSVPTVVMCESNEVNYGGADIPDFDITWRIAEPELLEVVSVHPVGVLGRQGGAVYEIPTFELPRGQTPGFAVRTLAPGTVHLYITVTHRDTGIYQTMQQIIVIEE